MPLDIRSALETFYSTSVSLYKPGIHRTCHIASRPLKKSDHHPNQILRLIYEYPYIPPGAPHTELCMLGAPSI
jgi:hypothetical protein